MWPAKKDWIWSSARKPSRYPAPTLRDFMLTVKTKTVLYNTPELEITDQVLTALDQISK